MAAPKFQTPRVEPRTVSPILREMFREMKRQRVTMTDMAARMNMGRVGLCYWKSGRSQPTSDKLEIFASELGFRIGLIPK